MNKMKEAVFGVKLANKKYQDRFGAYGIVVNENQEMVIIREFDTCEL